MNSRIVGAVVGAVLVGVTAPAAAQQRIPHLVDQVDHAKAHVGPDASVLEIIVANPLGRAAIEQAEAALKAGTLNPADHEALRNAQLIPHPGDGQAFTGIVQKDGDEPILVFPNGTTLPDGSTIPPGGHLQLVADRGYSWQDQRVRETTAFLGEVTTVRGFLGPNHTLTVREFAPGTSHHFVAGRVRVDDKGRTIIRIANGDKDVIVDDPELAHRLKRFLEAKDATGKVIAATGATSNYMVIMPGFVESTLKPDGTVNEYHFKGMPEKLWLLNRLGRFSGRTTPPNQESGVVNGPNNGFKMSNGLWVFDIQTPINVGTLTVLDNNPHAKDGHPFPNTDATQRHYMLGMIPADDETLPIVTEDTHGKEIPGIREMLTYVRRFNATDLGGAPAMSHDVTGKTQAGTSIDRNAPINQPMLTDPGRSLGFEHRITELPTGGFDRQ